MRLLVIHGWLRGNLGDVLQGSVLLRALRTAGATTLDLAGFPSSPDESAEELLSLADRHVPEPFSWFWRYVPTAARALTIEPRWRHARSQLFSRYDAVVSAPGPFLAKYDARSPAALADLDVAANLGIPFVLASHSIGPLSSPALKKLSRATVLVAREQTTHHYLSKHGIASVHSADLAFLYPYEEALRRAPPPRITGPYRVLFLRAYNVGLRAIGWSGDSLRCGSHNVMLERGEKVVVATSDARRDRRFILALADKLGVPSVICRSTAELVGLVAGSTGVVSDRYHPAICSAVLGKPVALLANHEPHKMLGLQDLLDGNSIDDLKALARSGLAALFGAISAPPHVPPGCIVAPHEE